MELPKHVTIREVGPRDGFQSWPSFVPTARKIEVIRAMIKAGIQEIELTSFVSPEAIPQLRDASEIMKAFSGSACNKSALVPNLRGAEAACETGADQLVVVISATEQHNLANVRRPIADSIADLGPILELSRTHGCSVAGTVAVAFGCPYQGEVSHREVFRLVETYARHGVERIILGDTAGMATPTRVQNIIYDLNNNYQGINLALHFHNNRGTAMANLLAGLQAGIATFDTALGGIGGCPYVPNATGNLATEDVVYMLEDMGIQTGIDLRLLIEAAHRLQDILGDTLPGQVIKSGPRKHTTAD